MKTPEHLPQNETEPNFADLVAAFGNQDTRVRMAYARHMDRPSAKTNEEVHESVDELTVAFFHLTRKLFHGDMGTVEERCLITASLFDELIDSRIALFEEYAVFTQLDEDDKQQARTELIADLTRALTDSPEAFREEMGDQFNSILSTDARILSEIATQKADSMVARKLGKAVLDSSKDALKIGAGVALGLIVANRFSQKS